MNGLRGFAAIGLVNPKHRLNVGSVLRAAGCYGASLVVLGGTRPRHYMGRIATDTQKAYRHIPTVCVDDVFDVCPEDCVPVAVDLLPHAIDLAVFSHPERAFYLFGPEDGTLSEAVVQRCTWAVQIETAHCLNLAAAVNVVLYDRLAKQRRSVAHRLFPRVAALETEA